MTNPARILLVDDEIAIQRTTGPLLRSRGYDVEIAGTGRDALDAVHLHPPHLIVLDLGLPVIDGYAFVVLLGTLAINVGVSRWERAQGERLESPIL